MEESVSGSHMQKEAQVEATSRSARQGMGRLLAEDQAYFVEVLAGACQGTLLAYRSSLLSSSPKQQGGLPARQ